jgi:hypothetical protein
MGRITLFNEERTMSDASAGDFWQTLRHVPHGGRTLDVRCVVLDIFAPPREEYRQAGSGLGSVTLSH